MSKFLFIVWIIIALAVFVYSYGFVDLNLTLSSHPLIFNSVSYLQQLVYFNRPLSLNIFIALIVFSFALYGVTVARWHSPRLPWRFLIALSVILALAYPMLSSDVFKYLFSAKEILVYHANPYLVTPDTFGSDPWIRFMRWVHTPTPYGPVFTALTIPYYLLGFGKFVPILYLFKLDQIAWYLLAVWLIGKLTRSTRSQLYFALNPLILMEWLVNAHNDAIMITLLLLSIYLLTLGKKMLGFFALLLSIGIKYVTVLALPLIFLPSKYQLLATKYLLLALFLAPLLYHYSWQYQPWYVTWLIPLAALTTTNWIRWGVATYSFSVFTRYLFFVGTGSWLGTPLWHALMTFVLPLSTIGLLVLRREYLRLSNHPMSRS